MTFRCRKLLDLAHRVTTCMNCGCHTAGCEPAHENGVTAGKGFGHKTADNRHAAMCHRCHAHYDQGTGLDPSGLYEGRDGKREMWIRAHLKTFDLYWSNGWIKT